MSLPSCANGDVGLIGDCCARCRKVGCRGDGAIVPARGSVVGGAVRDEVVRCATGGCRLQRPRRARAQDEVVTGDFARCTSDGTAV